MAPTLAAKPPLPGMKQQQQNNDVDVDVEQLLAGPLAMPEDAANPHSQYQDFTSISAATMPSNNNNTFGAGLADANRAQNVALKVQLAASERELAQCRHALDLALVKAGNWSGMKHRVTLAKPLNAAPLKQWGSSSNNNINNSTANNAQTATSESSRANFVISSLQSQIREKDLQLTNSNIKLEEMAQLLRDSEKQAAFGGAGGDNNNINRAGMAGSSSSALQPVPGIPADAEHILGGSDQAKTALAAHLMAQMRFLHSEVERLEKALAEQRERDSSNAVQRGMQTARELQQRDQKIAILSNQLSSLKSKLTPLQRAALNNMKEESGMSPMDLLTRIGQLEQDLAAAINARNEALNEKYSLGNKIRKLEERVRDTKSSAVDAQNSAVEEVMISAQQVARLRDALATAGRERDNLQAALDIRRLKEASKRLSSVECQTDEKIIVDSVMQTDPTERPKVDSFCQVEGDPSSLNFSPLTLLPAGTSSRMQPVQTISSSNTTENNNNSTTQQQQQHVGGDALSIAHALELKCAELDNIRARLEEQALQLERTQLALKQTRDALNAEVEVRKNLDGESERNKAQIRTLQQTVSQLHVLLRDRDAALTAADERAQAALNDSVKLAQERKTWEKQLAANAHDFEQLMAQQSTASQQVSQAAQENEALREEVSRLLQREAQLSHALRAKDSELVEVLSSYQACVQENEATGQGAKSIERECNNLKAAVQMREERIAEMQRELQQLHQREEQLVTDVQACDYENGLLHRKVVQADTQSTNMNAAVSDMEQQLAAQRRVTNEFERAQAEIHKQLIIKDNEVIFLKKRCDQVEHECTMLQTQHNVEKHKLRELEETNARLTVSGLMNQISASSTSHHTNLNSTNNNTSSNPNVAATAESRAREVAKSRQSMDELAHRNGFLARQIEVKDGNIAQLQQQISEERKNVEMLRNALSEKAVQFEQCQRAMEELKAVVSEQARTLAIHASQTGFSDSDA